MHDKNRVKCRACRGFLQLVFCLGYTSQTCHRETDIVCDLLLFCICILNTSFSMSFSTISTVRTLVSPDSLSTYSSVRLVIVSPRRRSDSRTLVCPGDCLTDSFGKSRLVGRSSNHCGAHSNHTRRHTYTHTHTHRQN